MSPQNDGQRAAIMTAIKSLFPVLILFGVYNFTDAQIAAIVIFVEAAVTALGYFIKTGQQAAQEPIATVYLPDDQELRYEHPRPEGGDPCVSWIPEMWDGSPTKCSCGALLIVGSDRLIPPPAA